MGGTEGQQATGPLATALSVPPRGTCVSGLAGLEILVSRWGEGRGAREHFSKGPGRAPLNLKPGHPEGMTVSLHQQTSRQRKEPAPGQGEVPPLVPMRRHGYRYPKVGGRGGPGVLATTWGAGVLRGQDDEGRTIAGTEPDQTHTAGGQTARG